MDKSQVPEELQRRFRCPAVPYSDFRPQSQFQKQVVLPILEPSEDSME